MSRLLKRLFHGETGQVLPAVLALLVLGGLVITPMLDYTTTSIKSNRDIGQNVRGIYAADAGVEYALWCIKNSTSPPAQLPNSVNGMNVSLTAVNQGDFTLFLGELIPISGHADYLEVNGNAVWNPGANAYEYTITATRRPIATGNINLEGIGARLPIGYSYQAGSAAGFPGNLSGEEPEITTDGEGAMMVNWRFGSPFPLLTAANPTRTQKFYMTGTGDLDGDYTWAVARREDVGTVGEITGTIYLITATATHPATGELTARIESDIMKQGTSMYIIGWRILN